MNSSVWSRLEAALVPNADVLTQTGQFPRQAAVIALITDAPSPELIFTLRSKHLSHHAGEVCFPGGMWELQDTSLMATALRETHEEIGLAPNRVEVMGALSVRPTRSGTLVRPFVGRISADNRFHLNPHELDTLFSVPLADFEHGLQVRTDVFEHQGKRYSFPAYVYQGHEIWGFTAGVTAELLSLLRSFPSDNR